ncbi:MAG: diadenylate cyclase CdaA [Acutalibacteraceae bacterium]|nr:diadenylate cyclase CdaA [Acutalibacteraceae bacterium]
MTELINSVINFFSQVYVTFLAVMSSFRFIDLIDILVVAFLIYKVIQFAKGTRTKQLIYGVLLFLLIWFISSIFEMKSLYTLLSSVLTQGVVALAVIFQPEIRTALELLSKSKFKVYKSDYSNEEIVNCIDSVCSACSDFQKDRVGALIVFEREVKLGDIVRSGVVVDSKAKPELISNIFYPNTPLHDGAMIIRNGRILAAGCILPLTSNINIHKSLGTRHRASLGMSENSDAIVVVVSEETGIISIAQGGVLKRNFNQSSLNDYLSDQLLDKDIEKTNGIISLLNKLKRGKKDEK